MSSDFHMRSAKKRFGQNFLVDMKKADALVKALELENGDAVIEVGPGKGILTERLAKHEIYLQLVEVDRELITLLKDRFGDRENIEIIENDIIKHDPSKFAKKRVKLIGNLPYNISGAMVEWLIRYHHLIDRAVITVQKEVAERLRAASHRREYGSLSVITQAFYNIKKLFSIPPGCFSPRPKVDSTALILSPELKIPLKVVKEHILESQMGREAGAGIDPDEFIKFVRACFAQKRKTLINSLSSSLNLERGELSNTIMSSGYDEDVRAEQFQLRDFVRLWHLIAKSDHESKRQI